MRLASLCLRVLIALALCLVPTSTIALAEAAGDSQIVAYPEYGFDLDLGKSTTKLNIEESTTKCRIDIYVRLRSQAAGTTSSIQLGKAFRVVADKINENDQVMIGNPILNPAYPLHVVYHIENASGQDLNYQKGSFAFFKGYEVEPVSTSLSSTSLSGFTKQGTTHNADDPIVGAYAPDGTQLHYSDAYLINASQGLMTDLKASGLSSSASPSVVAAYSYILLDKTLANQGFTGNEGLRNYLMFKTNSKTVDELAGKMDKVANLLGSANFGGQVSIYTDDYSNSFVKQSLLSSPYLVFDGVGSDEDGAYGDYSCRLTDPVVAQMLEKYVTTNFYAASFGGDLSSDSMYSLTDFLDTKSSAYTSADEYVDQNLSTIKNGEEKTLEFAYRETPVANNLLQYRPANLRFTINLSSPVKEEPADPKGDGNTGNTGNTVSDGTSGNSGNLGNNSNSGNASDTGNGGDTTNTGSTETSASDADEGEGDTSGSTTGSDVSSSITQPAEGYLPTLDMSAVSTSNIATENEKSDSKDSDADTTNTDNGSYRYVVADMSFKQASYNKGFVRAGTRQLLPDISDIMLPIGTMFMVAAAALVSSRFIKRR